MLYLPHSLNGSVYHKHSDQLVDCLCILVELCYIQTSCPLPAPSSKWYLTILSILFHRDDKLRLPPALTSGQPLPETG